MQQYSDIKMNQIHRNRNITCLKLEGGAKRESQFVDMMISFRCDEFFLNYNHGCIKLHDM